jgi:hypothetical protein
MKAKLLTTKNAKIVKGRDRGYMIFGMHLLPGKMCNRATPGCLRACLNTSGNGFYPRVQSARARKSRLFWTNLDEFLTILTADIYGAVRYAKKKGYTPAFRLNLTSDIPWECYGIPQKFPNVQFYDYTKYHDRHMPDNYHLTFSRSESLNNHVSAKKWLVRGGNVAVVFRGEQPKEFWGHEVISGDSDDLRFLDPTPCIVGLKAKGKAQTDTSGFVIRAA